MIASLLRELCEVPGVTFQDADLRRRDLRSFTDLKAKGFLRKARDLGIGDCYIDPGGERLLTIVDCPRAGLEALDLDDPDFPSVRLSDSALSRWELDRLRVAEAFKARNGLLGQPGFRSEYVLAIGDAASRINPVEYWLGLLPGTGVVSPSALVAAKTTFPPSKRHIVAVCPAFEPSLEMRTSLLREGIQLCGLTPEDTFALPPPAANVPIGPFSDDYRQALYNGEWRPLTPNQARVAELLYRVAKPLSEAYILETLDIASKTLYQVFRGSWAWGALIEKAPGQGMYRLNSPFSH
jgi:hypothetical protein